MHCHMETHQLEGMIVILKEGLHREMPLPPKNFPSCGSFKMSDREFEDMYNNPQFPPEPKGAYITL